MLKDRGSVLLLLVIVSAMLGVAFALDAASRAKCHAAHLFLSWSLQQVT